MRVHYDCITPFKKQTKGSDKFYVYANSGFKIILSTTRIAWDFNLSQNTQTLTQIKIYKFDERNFLVGSISPIKTINKSDI